MNFQRRSARSEDRLKRLSWLTAVGGLLWLSLVGRLVQVQGIDHPVYRQRAREQHERQLELKARRGLILDREGRTLAVEVDAVSFYAHPDQVANPDAVARHFAPFRNLSAETLASQLKGDRRFVYLGRQLDGVDLDQAQSRTFQGVFVHPEPRRFYPQGRLAGQLLGYTDIDNKGSEGLEWAFEDLLRQTHGSAFCQVDAKGAAVPGSHREDRKPEDGNTVVLTIDVVYQNILEQELERTIQSADAESGMGIISNPRTGEILAMANLPLYDPNAPAKTSPKWRRNRTVTDAYEPGSTFKAIVMAAVLEEQKARLDERIDCGKGRLQLSNGQVIRDHEEFDTLTVAQVIAQSSNIGTIKLARRLSRPLMYRYIRNFGFALRTGAGFPGENPGMLKEVAQWSSRSLETIAIGQEISVTALQLALAIGAIANDGVLMAPQILKGIILPDGQFQEMGRPQVIRRVVSPATAASLRQMMAEVVDLGTGKLARIEGLKIAGKTGTAQQARKDGRGYDPNRNVVSFVGFLPAEDPELLCLIVIENPQRDRWGGRLAAPAFKQVAERIVHLPEGMNLAFRQQAEPRAERLAKIIPDLRGMTPQVARFQAGLRGVSVIFSGAGAVVVEQLPPPGARLESSRQVSCVLGDPSQPVSGIPGTTLLRQAQLLETLTRVSEPGL